MNQPDEPANPVNRKPRGASSVEVFTGETRRARGRWQVRGSRLTAEQVGEIIEALATGTETQVELAAQYDVTNQTIRAINTGMSWEWVASDRPRPLRDFTVRRPQWEYACEWCGEPFGTPYPQTRYCSNVCRHVMASERAKDHRAEARVPRACGRPRPLRRPLGRSKLTEVEVVEIVAALAAGIGTQVELAEHYDVSQTAISQINRGTTWRWVQPARTRPLQPLRREFTLAEVLALDGMEPLGVEPLEPPDELERVERLKADLMFIARHGDRRDDDR